MTPDEIIAQLWQMSFWDVLKVAMTDDLILFVKAWSFLIFIIIIVLVFFGVGFEKERIRIRINYDG